MIRRLHITTTGQGLHDFTAEVRQVVREAAADEGLCTLFLRHTSASLVIQENADPSARRDLEAWLCRLVSEDDPLYTHTISRSRATLMETTETQSVLLAHLFFVQPLQ